MKVGAIVIAILMLLTGGVWIGQGLGYIKGSFMTGDMKWFWIGIVLVVGALALSAFAVRSSPAKKKTLP
ncbi:MAG TPA: hypothetical protein VI384_01900 [Candidatus Dormibacteraeota bacterium]